MSTIPLPAGTKAESPNRLNIQKGDRLILLGNTFAERLTLFGHFETLLNTNFSEENLEVRNLGWSADTVDAQPRPLNFGDLHTHLNQQKADVIFLCFGMTESFEGTVGLPKFDLTLRDFIDALLVQKYNDKSPPRLVLVSPIPHERLGENLPDPEEHNQQIKSYTETMQRVATDKKLPFVDLFTPVLPLMQDQAASKLTFNGIHLNEYGDWVISQIMMEQLGLAHSKRIEIDVKTKTANVGLSSVQGFNASGSTVTFLLSGEPVPTPAPPATAKVHHVMAEKQPKWVVKNLQAGAYMLKIDGQPVAVADHLQWERGVTPSGGPGHAAAHQLRQAVIEKNKQFFLRWRAVNGEYIYGRRAEPFGVVNFPGEMKQLDHIVADADKAVWSLSKPLETQTIQLLPVDK
jgi:lysophospholipase L1-like esterase